MTTLVVGAERVVAVAAWGDVDRGRVDLKLSLAANDLDEPITHLRVDLTGHRAVLELGLLRAQVRQHLCACSLECEGTDVSPLRADVGLNAGREHDAVLRRGLREIELLPDAREGNVAAMIAAAMRLPTAAGVLPVVVVFIGSRLSASMKRVKQSCETGPPTERTGA
jgi:hypothetical protein